MAASQFYSSPWYRDDLLARLYSSCRVLAHSVQIGISLSYAIWCVSFNLTVFMIARIVGGLAKANVAITLAIVSDVTTENDRNRAMVSEQ